MPPSQNTGQPYDFILKQDQSPKKSLMPANLSGPVLVIVAIIVLMLVIIIGSTLLLGKSKINSGDLVGLIGQAQEINRINTLEQQNIKDPSTADLLVTTQLALTSEQAGFSTYAQAHKIKVDSKKLALYQNSQTDSQLAAAAQSNNLSSAYSAYLKQALTGYAGSLSAAYQHSKDASLRTLIKNAYLSTETLLGNPPKSS